MTECMAGRRGWCRGRYVQATHLRGHRAAGRRPWASPGAASASASWGGSPCWAASSCPGSCRPSWQASRTRGWTAPSACLHRHTPPSCPGSCRSSWGAASSRPCRCPSWEEGLRRARRPGFRASPLATLMVKGFGVSGFHPGIRSFRFYLGIQVLPRWSRDARLAPPSLDLRLRLVTGD